jgi:hypothetical protein
MVIREGSCLTTKDQSKVDFFVRAKHHYLVWHNGIYVKEKFKGIYKYIDYIKVTLM